MSWLFSQALVGEYLGDISSDGEPSVQSNGNPIQQAYCSLDKMTAFSRLSQFGMTFKPLTADRGEELLTSYLEAFHAKTLVQQEKVTVLTESDQECGNTWHAWLAKYDPVTSLWKTPQCLLFGAGPESLETLPRWGMTQNGLLWELPTLEPITSEIGCGSLRQMWLTPRVVEIDETPENFRRRMNSKRKNDRKNGFGSLTMQVKAQIWPTPRSCSAMAATITDKGDRFPNLETVMAHTDKTTVGGKLNPTWVEWLMGWPLGWTDLKPLEMDKCHSVQQPHGES